MTQSIEEFLVKVGVDVGQAKKINDVIAMLNNLASETNSTVKDVVSGMNSVGSSSNKAMSEVSKSADKAERKVSKLKIAFIALVAGAVLYGNKIANAFNSAIDNAKNLAYQRNALFKVSQTEINQAEQYQRAMVQTKLSIDSVATKIALNLVPNLTHAANGFNQWLTVNKDLVANGITAVVKGIGSVIQLIVNGARFINMIVSNTIGWKVALMLVAGAFIYLKRAMLASPIGILMMAITGLLLLFDDLMVYLDGGKSAFGEYWEVIINGIKSVMNWWNNLDKNWKTVIYGLLGYVALLVGQKGILSIGAKLASTAKSVVGSLGFIGKSFRALTAVVMSNPILAIITAIAVAAYLIYDNWDFLVGFFSNLWSNIKSFFSDGIKSILMYFGMSEEGAINTVNTIGDAFNLVVDLITLPFMNAWDFIKSLFNIWTDDSTSTVDKIGKSFSAVFDVVTAPFKAAAKWIEDKFMGTVNKAIGWVKKGLSFIGLGGNDEENASKIDSLSSASTSPSVAGNQMMTTNNSNQQSAKYDINVEQHITTSDPVEAGKQSSSGMTDAINQAKSFSGSAIAQ